MSACDGKAAPTSQETNIIADTQEKQVEYAGEPIKERPRVATEVKDVTGIHKKAAEAKKYVKQKGMNTDWCILIDFSYNLYTKRMFI